MLFEQPFPYRKAFQEKIAIKDSSKILILLAPKILIVKVITKKPAHYKRRFYIKRIVQGALRKNDCENFHLNLFQFHI